jgi:Fe-S-cluster containining protein
MFTPLSRDYVCHLGAPIIRRVDPDIFRRTYFNYCMDCTFCHDSCCQYGCDVNTDEHARLLARADVFEPIVGTSRTHWFDTDWNVADYYPTGRYVRALTQTTPHGERCVFANRAGRGCALHAHALQHGYPVYDIKPMVCSLFPVLPSGDALIVPLEIQDGSLVCINQGPTLYRSARTDLGHYFGPDLLAELDALEATVVSPATTMSLPLV